MKYPVPVVLITGMLAACQIDTSQYPESSPFKPVPVGATLELHQPITIPADKLAVYLQAGEIRPYANIGIIRPYCKFELYRHSDKARVVRPDSFRIIKVTNNQALGFPQGNVRVAEARVGMGVHMRLGAGGDDGSPSMVTYMTEMRLKSASQPEVFKMSCGRLDDLGSEFLSIEEMRKVLGTIFSLKTGQ